MQIIEYEFLGLNEELKFSKVKFGKVNLLVGDTGTGKTRLLNTIFSLGTNAVSELIQIKTGSWDTTLSQNGKQYRWVLEIMNVPDKGEIITKDNIWMLNENEQIPLVKRDRESFVFQNKDLPKLPQNKTSIFLLKDEEDIHPLHEGFSTIMRRHFSQDALEKVTNYQTIPFELSNKLIKNPVISDLRNASLFLNATLFLLHTFFPDIYSNICKNYRSVFPFIEDITILMINELHPNISTIGNIPIFCIKEKYINKWIELGQLSSGMQKVLLVLTDINLLTDGGIYLIDEYENSLGINAIDFFPSGLIDSIDKNQFIITSHHPYLINSIPVKDWFIFHRKGNVVTIKSGQDLVERFGKSKQEAFIKLINDPFYTQGIE